MKGSSIISNLVFHVVITNLDFFDKKKKGTAKKVHKMVH
jgi:hypothetical protein